MSALHKFLTAATKKTLELLTRPLRLLNIFKCLISFVINHLAIYDVLIKGGFWVIPKIKNS